ACVRLQICDRDGLNGPRKALNPLGMLGDPSVYAIITRSRATPTPAHDADLIGTAAAVVADQRSAAVSLARVAPTLLEPGAELSFVDLIVGIVFLALPDRNGGDGSFQQTPRAGRILMSIGRAEEIAGCAVPQ